MLSWIYDYQCSFTNVIFPQQKTHTSRCILCHYSSGLMPKSMRTTRWLFCSHNKLRQICPYFKTYSESIGSESKTSFSVFFGVSSDDATSLGLGVNFVAFFFLVSASGSVTPSSPSANITSCSG